MQKIYYRNKGGIGNQLFIYSFAKSISIKLNKILFIDNTSGFKRDFYKRTPGINLIIDDAMPEANFFIKLLFRINKYIPEKILNLFGIILIIEKSNRELLNINYEKLIKFPIILIEGYFQSYKYFIDYKIDILEKAFIDFNLNEKYRNFYKMILDSDSVSIHVRRNQYDNLLEMDYYIKALNIFEKQNIDAKYFVFTDDIVWCRDNFKNPSFVFIEVDNPDEIQELYLMSTCKHNIIANSSFSWWAAFFSNKKNSIVVAPRNTQIGVFDKFYPIEWNLIN